MQRAKHSERDKKYRIELDEMGKENVRMVVDTSKDGYEIETMHEWDEGEIVRDTMNQADNEQGHEQDCDVTEDGESETAPECQPESDRVNDDYTDGEDESETAPDYQPESDRVKDDDTDGDDDEEESQKMKDTNEDEGDDEETVLEIYQDFTVDNGAIRGGDKVTVKARHKNEIESKHHPLLGVVSSMIQGGVYLHCECGHVRRVEEKWAGRIALDGPGFVDQMKPCPHSLYRRMNSFKKMKLHIKKCTSKEDGGRAPENELPPLFQRTYKNKIVNSRRG